jgi:hypothetical protein
MTYELGFPRFPTYSSRSNLVYAPGRRRHQILTNWMAQFGGQRGTLGHSEPRARIQSWPLVG